MTEGIGDILARRDLTPEQKKRRRKLMLLMMAAEGGGEGVGSQVASIQFTAAALQDNAEVNDPVGTATIEGTYTGTPSWSLANDASGKYAIDSSTGAVTVADTLTVGNDTIVIAVAGVTPSVGNVAFGISVSPEAGVRSAFGLLFIMTKPN